MLDHDGALEVDAAASWCIEDNMCFELSPDGRIRAEPGLAAEPGTPPALLYHRVAARFVASIREHGLTWGSRRPVQLSEDPDPSSRSAAQRGKPVILAVRAADMVAAGHRFLRAPTGAWLVDHVPAQFIEFPANHSSGRGSRSMKVAIAKTSLAACEAGFYTSASGARVPLADALAAAVAGTVMHEPGQFATRAPRPMTITVTGETTIEALVRLAPRGGHLGCLNFASAKHPGGGFLGGAQAQEESLARASGLYPCQASVPAFYEANRAHRSPIYRDAALFSPGVPFFRDDDGGWLDAVVLASVITCPAPNASALHKQGRFDAGEVERVLRRRAELVLAIARHHAIDHLVLGAWGAGVFRNDPAVVADAFQQLLAGEYRGAFAEVVFAVLGDRESSANHRAFADAFASSRPVA